MRRRDVTSSAVILASAVALCACSFDRRETVAYQTLVEGEGLNKPAYSAAIAARFPPGSSVATFRAYVLASGGECRVKSDERIWCEIPYRIKLCAAAMIGLDVAVSKDSINAIHVEFGGLGC
jgi:hypothetical protein